MTGFSRRLKRLGITYERYRIFECQPGRLRTSDRSRASRPVSVALLDADTLEQAAAPELRALREYGGAESRGFAAIADGRLAAVCWYWWGNRYRTRGFIALPPTAAKLVQVTTAAEFRGFGIAPALIAESSRLMADRGFDLLLARVWHTNAASNMAFAKAGWHEREIITVLKMPLLSEPLRICSKT